MVEAKSVKVQNKKPTAKKSTPKIVKTETPVTIVEPIVEQSVDNLEVRIKALIEENENMIKTIKNNKQELKNILVSYQKELKGYKKKKNRVKSEYIPHGFTKAVNISGELAFFLGQEADALVARPTVTKAIAKYVRENSLANAEDGSVFSVDKNLKKILGEALYPVKKSKPELGLGYSYQNLQKYLSVHFNKVV